MREVAPDSRTNNAGFGIEPGDLSSETVSFQTDKRTDCQADMVALLDFQPVLPAFHSGELLQAPMVGFDLPGIQGTPSRLFDGHIQPAGRPIFRVAVFVHCPKYFDPAIALEMNDQALRWDEDIADRPIATVVGADFPVFLELGQPVPTKGAYQLQVRQPRVPAVKRHQLRLKAALAGLRKHVLKMVVLAQSVLAFVVEAKVARQTALPVGPYQRNQVDALHHLLMLPRPVSSDQRHVTGVGLIQGAVIDYQHAFSQVYQWLDFLPQPLAVGRQTLQQTRVGVMRWGSLFSGVCQRGFHTTKHALGCDQKVDVIHFVAFRWVHAPSVACPCSTA